MKRFEQDNKVLVFYKKENDSKYSFLIENDKELTEWLLSNTKTHRIREDKIKYAVKGIFEKLKEYNNKLKPKSSINMENPIITLAELVQKTYGANIETRVVKKVGEDHCPTIFVEVELPNGKIYADSGSNQKEAKKRACLKALKEEFNY